MLTRRQFMRAGAALGGSGVLPKSSPASQSAAGAGYFYPDEARPHERTFMQWPVNRQVHVDGVFLSMLQKTIAAVANTISEFEPAVMLMAREHETGARKLLGSKVEIWDVATDDLWCRDSGPSFVINGKGGLAVTQFNFNGWGNKQTHPNDGRIAGRIAERMSLPLFDSGLVGEAGGVEADGAGTLLAHESSWINPNRDSAGRAEIERKLLETTGARKVIWAPGIRGADITDYHIDALARFVRPGAVLIQMPGELDPDDPWSKSAFETREILGSATDADGNRLQIFELAEPQNMRVGAPDFVASYVNYYVCNGAVITAEFGDEAADRKALQALSELYPGREIVALNIDPVGEVGGGIHCATHEQPKV